MRDQKIMVTVRISSGQNTVSLAFFGLVEFRFDILREQDKLLHSSKGRFWNETIAVVSMINSFIYLHCFKLCCRSLSHGSDAWMRWVCGACV